jgi:hypothetical protein
VGFGEARLVVTGSQPQGAEEWCLARLVLGCFWPPDWPISPLIPPAKMIHPRLGSDFQSGRGPCVQKVTVRVKRGIPVE